MFNDIVTRDREIEQRVEQLQQHNDERTAELVKEIKTKILDNGMFGYEGMLVHRINEMIQRGE